jgi:hypothetical protein
VIRVGLGPGSWSRWCLPSLVLLALAVAAERLLWAGKTYDEPLHLEGLRGVLDFAAQVLAGSPGDYAAIPANYEYYGIGALLPSYAISGLLGWVLPWPEPLRWSAAVHLLAQASYLACLWSCWHIVRPSGRRAALLATLSVALLPEVLGHGLMNYKDMPVAAGVLLCVQATLVFRRAPGPGGLLALGAAASWLAAQKLAGLGLVLPCLALVLCTVAARRSTGLWLALAGTGAATLLLIYLLTPPAWVEPWRFLLDSAATMARFDWGGCMVAAGICIGPQDAAWSPLAYLWQWSLAKIPLPYLLAWAVALPLALRRPRAEALLPLACVLPVLLLIALRGSTLYDALRHVLFLLPLLCCAAAAAGVFERRWTRVAAGLVLAWLAIENLRFYPYNYAWFTPTTSLAAQRGGYDTDYWGYSLRAAVDQVPAGASVTGTPHHLVEPFAALRPSVVPGAPRYHVYFNRGQPQPPRGCEPVDRIARHTLLGHKIVMSRIAQCRSSP